MTLQHSPWLIIPAYNEADRLGAVLRELRAVLGSGSQIVVVDDGSTDGTGSVAAGHDTWVLRHIVNRGQGAALQTGINFALHHHAQVIVTFDADGQHVAADIPQMVAPLTQGRADVVLGSRFLGTADGVPLLRRLLLKTAVIGTRLTTGLKLTDTHNGLRAMTAAAAVKLHLTEDGMAHASELLRRLADAELCWTEVPVTVRYTEQTLAKGQSNRAAFQIAFRMVVAKVIG